LPPVPAAEATRRRLRLRCNTRPGAGQRRAGLQQASAWRD